MYCTDRVMTCRTLTIEDESTEIKPLGAVMRETRRYRVTVLTSSRLRGVIRSHDPTLPRDSTDLSPLRLVVRIDDPTLPRGGTDLMGPQLE